VVHDIVPHLMTHDRLNSSGEPRLSRLSFSVMRMVLAKPLTLALMRVVWRLASISYTSLVGIPWHAPF